VSADIIKLPERQEHPNAALCAGVVGCCRGDEGKLFELALLALLRVQGRRGQGALTRRDLRRLVNRLSIAWLALGEILSNQGGGAEGYLPDDTA
jgi:hypothetical protein